MDGRTDRRTDGWTDGQMDGPSQRGIKPKKMYESEIFPGRDAIEEGLTFSLQLRIRINVINRILNIVGTQIWMLDPGFKNTEGKNIHRSEAIDK